MGFNLLRIQLPKPATTNLPKCGRDRIECFPSKTRVFLNVFVHLWQSLTHFLPKKVNVIQLDALNAKLKAAFAFAAPVNQI